MAIVQRPPSSVPPPVRMTNVGQRDSSRCAPAAGQVDCKAAAVVSVGGRLPVGPHISQGSPPTTVHPAPMPTQAPHPPKPLQSQPQPPQQAQPKIQPSLQRLPKFRPPVFEDVDGLLPLPDSPESTPRNGDEDAAQSQEVISQMYDNAFPPSQHQHQHIGRHTEPEPEQPVAEPPGVYPVGTFVEYKSRSSGLWILARVEGFDESTRNYRLDVQPHANPDRVRPRGAGRAPPEDVQEPDLSVRAARTSSQLPVSEKADHNYDPEYAPRTTMVSLQEEVSRSPSEPAANMVEPVSSPQRTSSWREAMPGGMLSATPPVGTADRRQLLREAMALKEQVARMEAEIDILQERIRQEAALKDRYFAELCLCREHLQRVRSTPR